jgi:hypothetical protein
MKAPLSIPEAGLCLNLVLQPDQEILCNPRSWRMLRERRRRVVTT